MKVETIAGSEAGHDIFIVLPAGIDTYILRQSNLRLYFKLGQSGMDHFI
jgi:hypothetical protein